MKLKTFQDIKDECDKEINQVNPEIALAQCNAIFNMFTKSREEAIKWLKEDIRCMDGLEKDGYLWNCADTRIDFLKDFFDITEEELK